MEYIFLIRYDIPELWFPIKISLINQGFTLLKLKL